MLFLYISSPCYPVILYLPYTNPIHFAKSTYDIYILIQFLLSNRFIHFIFQSNSCFPILECFFSANSFFVVQSSFAVATPRILSFQVLLYRMSFTGQSKPTKNQLLPRLYWLLFPKRESNSFRITENDVKHLFIHILL